MTRHFPRLTSSCLFYSFALALGGMTAFTDDPFYGLLGLAETVIGAVLLDMEVSDLTRPR